MKRPTNGSLSVLVGLLSSAIAAWSCTGKDSLVTVGVRPTGEVAASGGTPAGGAGGLPVPGTDVMTPTLDGSTTPGPGDAGAGASGGSSSAGSGVEPARDAGRDAGGGAAADAPGPLGPDEDECGAIPAQPAGNVTSGRVGRSGLIGYEIEAPNAFVGLRTTLAVPAKPPPTGHIFIWPGIQPTPTAANLQGIGNGALLSVLAWGPLCPPDVPESYSTWWIAPMYTNLSTTDPQYAGCHGGKVVRAETEQRFDIAIRRDGSSWVQKVVNRDTLEESDFSMDLKGQAQGRVFFDIELQTSNKPTEDIVFTDTVLSMDMSQPDACQPVLRGTNDFASAARVSADGKHCCIDRIVLRAPGVAATTTDPP